MVNVRVLASSALDNGSKQRSSQIKDYKIAICCFSAKHAPLRRKNRDWLARNQNVSEWSEMSTRELLFHYKNPTRRVVLEQSGPRHHLIEQYFVLAMK